MDLRKDNRTILQDWMLGLLFLPFVLHLQFMNFPEEPFLCVLDQLLASSVLSSDLFKAEEIPWVTT